MEQRPGTEHEPIIFVLAMLYLEAHFNVCDGLYRAKHPSLVVHNAPRREVLV